MTAEGGNSLKIGVAMLVAGACGLAAWTGLTALATPPDFAGRRAALTQRVAQLEHLARLPADTGAFGPRAVCPATDAAAIQSVRAAIQGASGGDAGVKLTYVALQPVASPSTTARLAPVTLDVRAEGSYSAMSAFIDRLVALQPVVFVDRLDLQSAKPDVTLKLSGKVFCWTSA
jgi:hypothetical protein